MPMGVSLVNTVIDIFEENPHSGSYEERNVSEKLVNNVLEHEVVI